MKDVSLKIGRNLLFFLYNGWLEEGADLMGLLPLADKYDIQVANSCTLSDEASSLGRQV